MTKSISAPIAIAECASTAVSLGAVLALSHFESVVNPVRDVVAKKFIYPMTVGKPAPEQGACNDPQMAKARDKASALVKGSAMIGAGFLSHIPIQLALEGHCDVKSVRQVVMGKGAGIGIALGSIIALNKLAPSAMPAVQHAVCPIIEPFLPKKCGCDHGCSPSQELCHLMTVEIPSSIMSGLVNYGITRRALRMA